MIDLRDDGTIGIDFDDGQGVVTIRRPKFGEFKRLRAEAANLAAKQAERRVTIEAEAERDRAEREDPDAPDEVRDRAPYDAASTFEEAVGELVSGWWLLVLRGDNTFNKLADKPVPDPDDWPAEMIVGTVRNADQPIIELPNGIKVRNQQGLILEVLDHWRQVPLARGGQPVSTVANPSGNGHSLAPGLMR